MKTITAVCIIIFCIPAFCIGEEFEFPEDYFKKDNPILAEDFNNFFGKIADKLLEISELEDKITALEKSLKETQASLAQLQSIDSQLKEIKRNTIPEKTVAAFYQDECPDGWSDFDKGAGRFILGAGQGDDGQKKLTMRYFKQVDGEENHQLTIDEMPKHKHVWRGVRADRKDDGGFGGSELNVNRASGDVSDISEERGGDQPHNNMPPFIVLRFCIKESQ